MCELITLQDLPDEIILYNIATPKSGLFRKEIQALNVALGLTFKKNMVKISQAIKESNPSITDDEVRKISFGIYCNFYVIKRPLEKQIGKELLRKTRPELAFNLITPILPNKSREKFPRCSICQKKGKFLRHRGFLTRSYYSWILLDCQCPAHTLCAFQNHGTHSTKTFEHYLECPRYIAIQKRAIGQYDK